MTHNGNESSDEGIDNIIFEKEILRFSILFWSDEYIFPIFFEKWFPEPTTDDPIIQQCSQDRTKSSDDDSEEWIDIPIHRRDSCRNHDQFGRNGQERRLECHQHKDINIGKVPEKMKEGFDERMHEN